MENNTLRELSSIIKEANNITLLSHLGPDGDSLGSLTALSLALVKMDKKVEIGLEETVSKSFSYMDKFVDFSLKDFLPEAELYIVVDTADIKRIPFSSELLERRKKGAKIIVIDHHSSGDPEEIADSYFVDPSYSATSEIIYELLLELGTEIDRDIATSLLTGIESDTSSFQNQNTSSRTFETASKLVSKGARISTIIKNAFLEAPIEVLKIRGLVLERLDFNKKFRTAASYVLLSDFEKFKVSAEMIEGIANLLNGINDVDILFFIKEKDPGVFKVSMRSRNKEVDLSKMAEKYGGGGHKGASGFLWEGSIFDENGNIKFLNLDDLF